jgi:hypothetical protein
MKMNKSIHYTLAANKGQTRWSSLSNNEINSSKTWHSDYGTDIEMTTESKVTVVRILTSRYEINRNLHSNYCLQFNQTMLTTQNIVLVICKICLQNAPRLVIGQLAGYH